MTIPLAPAVIGIKKHFMFHIRLNSVVWYLQLNFFSASFCVTYPSDGVAASIRLQVIIIIIIIIIIMFI